LPEDWNLFERHSGGEQTVVFMNTALKEVAPLEGFSQLITIVFNMYSLWDAAGSKSRTAQDMFYSLEDKLMHRLSDTKQAIYTGRISIQNKMELYFYANDDVSWENKLQEIMVDFPAFRYYFSVREDEDWSFFKEEMFPSPLEEQWMRNAKIAFALHRHGDNAEAVREVEHWLHFASKLSMDEVKGKARQLGYIITNAEMDASKTINPYVLQLRKKHALDLATVNEVTRELFTLAVEAGGTYDGWGTRLRLKLPARIKFALIKWSKKPLIIGVITGIVLIGIIALFL
jgi:regulator of RNase E activity RraB